MPRGQLVGRLVVSVLPGSVPDLRECWEQRLLHEITVPQRLVVVWGQVAPKLRKELVLQSQGHVDICDNKSPGTVRHRKLTVG